MSDRLVSVVAKEPLKSVLSLVDGTNLHFSMKVMNVFNQQSQKIDLYLKATAVVGVSGLVKVMYDGVAKFAKANLKTFNGKEKALSLKSAYLLFD